MLYKTQSIHLIRRFTRLSWVFPYITLLIWILPLLIFNSGQDSLMAHDEGLYAWRSRQIIESRDWIHPWSTPHHKTPGPYWLTAASYTLFGMTEASGRLPSMFFGTLSVLLLYEIGRILLSKKVAWLAAAILSVQFLWLQYCRLGTPDVPMVFLVLLAIWSLLKAELHPKYSYAWGFLTGLSFSLGFLIRSFMIFLPILALLPYLILQHRRHRHLANPMLYLGFAMGLTPTFIWLWLSFLHYGKNSFVELINFVTRLGSNQRGNNGLEFYVWNVPIKAFPWFFFSLLGLILAIRRPIPRYQLILVGFPLILFIELSLFSTRLPHYSLILCPFIALLAAVGLNWFGAEIQQEKKTRKNFMSPRHILTRNLSYIFGVLGALMVIAAVVAFIWSDAEVRNYAAIGLALGMGWLILPLVWIGRYHFGHKFLTVRYWIAGWLIPAWLALAVSGSTGIISNYNPDVKAFLQQPAIVQVLNSSPVYFVQIGGKTGVLLNFYTPHHGQKVEQVSELPVSSYAWIPAKKTNEISRPYRVIGTVQKVNLIQLIE
jgi:4-amino-4-deoxy-L-arabinose transferase-like glycosyltransferase